MLETRGKHRPCALRDVNVYMKWVEVLGQLDQIT